MKSPGCSLIIDHGASPPSRGAWIEISVKELKDIAKEVAPLAGGVD